MDISNDFLVWCEVKFTKNLILNFFAYAWKICKQLSNECTGRIFDGMLLMRESSSNFPTNIKIDCSRRLVFFITLKLVQGTGLKFNGRTYKEISININFK